MGEEKLKQTKLAKKVQILHNAKENTFREILVEDFKETTRGRHYTKLKHRKKLDNDDIYNILYKCIIQNEKH